MIPGEVEYLIFSDNGEIPRGPKRQKALEAATADYVSFFDDDDLPSADYVPSVMAAINGDPAPDVIGFKLRYFVDNMECGYAIHSYASESYPPVPAPDWIYPRARWQFHPRFPNHLNPVRRELALRAGFHDELDSGEDSDYMRRLARLKPREAFVDRWLYLYLKRRGDEPAEMTYEKRLRNEYLKTHPIPHFA